MREWVELFDEPRPSFEVLAILGSFVGVSSCWPCSGKSYIHCEVEVHTVYTRGYFKKLTKAYTPCNTFLLILHPSLYMQA